MFNKSYNPDVLTCLANLSSDEVFTPPHIVNQMLDLLPLELFSDKNTTFLDPVCKSGVFLREIAKRLMEGLKDEIPNDEERRNHIFKNQLYGIGITELTALLSRRSVYCSKTANGKYSIANFDDEQGNIKYERIEHNWKKGKCSYCGANQDEYERGLELETHAYQFIHTDNPEIIFNMRFDVIIGNPPYQMNDGGNNASSKPIYQLFVENGKQLKPRFLSMIIPSRWFSGGKGLTDFRNEMLNDKRITNIVDFFDSKDCFSGVDISGGICYFLWSRDYNSECEVKVNRGGNTTTMTRPLLEDNATTFIRFNEAVSIFRKVVERKEPSFSDIVSSRRPFGLATNTIVDSNKKSGGIPVFAYPKNGYVNNNLISKNNDWIEQYKVFISKAYGERGAFPYLVLAKPFIGEPNTVCTETYLVVGPFQKYHLAKNTSTYIRSKFFRFLVLLKKNTQDATSSVYEYVPTQNFDEQWTDEKLYKKYGLNQGEIDFIESMIRPMESYDE